MMFALGPSPASDTPDIPDAHALYTTSSFKRMDLLLRHAGGGLDSPHRIFRSVYLALPKPQR